MLKIENNDLNLFIEKINSDELSMKTASFDNYNSNYYSSNMANGHLERKYFLNLTIFICKILQQQKIVIMMKSKNLV